MSFSVYQIVILLGTINGVILLFSLSSLPLRFRKPARYLGFFILGYTLYLFNWMIFPQIGYQFNVPVFWIPTLYFLPALTIYFTKSITGNPDGHNRAYRMYLIPGMLDTVFQLVKWLKALTSDQDYVFPLDDRTEFFIYEGIGLLFSIICIRQIFVMTRNFTYKKGAAYVFYRHAFYFLVFVLVRWIILYSIDLFKPELLTFNLQFTFWLMDLSFFLFLGYKSLITPNMYSTRLLPLDKINSNEGEEAKQLLTLLKEDQLYLNPELGRRDLSEKMQISEMRVSGILNDELNTTFYGLVNQMRIEEAKRLIAQGLADQLSLEGVARESGFKSKTTFYKFFKKHTGVTPAEFLQSA
ncbi:MAG: helix-turn-helix domain-containing protein [Cyclobacteriaceae bacterium]